MKKLLTVLAIFALVLAACEEEVDNGNNGDNSDVIGIWKGSDPGGTITLDIAASTYVLIFTSSDGTVDTTMNGTWTRHGNTLSLQSSDNYYYGIRNISASLSGGTLLLTINFIDGPIAVTLSKGNNTSGGGETLSGTTLRIRNESFIAITDVIWNNVQFTVNQDSIRTGASVIKNVTAGQGYIYFKREGNPIAVRTAMISVGEDEQKEIVIGNDTSVMEVSNPGNNGTLQTFFSKSWIYIKQNTDVISLYGEYDFGGVLQGNNKDITFTIENIGGANLVLENVNGSRINLGENTAGYFSITQQPLASTIAPGNTTSFTVRFSPAIIGNNFSASVHITTNSQNAEEFAFRVKGNGRDYTFGDTGPGGGMVFYVEGGQYKECSGELGTYNWTDAMQTAQDYKGNGFTNWRLPDRGELSLMYQNLKSKGLGGFFNAYYWSSTEYGTSSAYDINFSNGNWSQSSKTDSDRVRAVRSFSQ